MRGRAAICLAGLVASVAIGACGGSSTTSSAPADNGVASKSPAEIVAAANTAINGLKSVHVAGSIVSGGQPITLNLDLVSGRGGLGNMSLQGLGFRLIVVNNFVYINATSAFWRKFGNAAAAALLQGKWLKASATSGSFGSLAGLLNLHHLLSAMLASHGTLTKAATTTVEGQKVIGVTDTTNGGVLYVATTGKAYPIELSKSGASGGHVLFGRFNETVALAAPATSIDYSKLAGG
jgi:hypothetical protein